MAIFNVYYCCLLLVGLVCQPVANMTSEPTDIPTVQPVANMTSAPTDTPTVAPDRRCSPPMVTVTISDDEYRCQNVYPLNITCSNWGVNTPMRFVIGSWRYANTIRLVNSYTRYPAVCVEHDRLKDQFGYYETVLNVTTGQGAFANLIPLIFEIAELSDPPQIIEPADIYVTERDTRPLVWNISYFDPDDDFNSTSKHNITSADIPEQLIIKTTTDGEAQYFELVRVKAFDADIYENRDMRPQDDFPSKRSINPELRFKRRSKSACTYAKYLFMRHPRKTRKERSARFPRQFKNDVGKTGPKVNFTLEISDETGLTTSSLVTVHINDLNDNEPVCESPGTVAIARHAEPQHSLFEMKRICIDQDFNPNNQISDYRLSKMQQNCMGVFAINRSGSLILKDPVPENMSTCEFDVVAMDPTYATSVHLKLAYGECAPSVDARGVLWNASQPGRIEHMSCPDGYTGQVSRFCNSYAKYEPAVYQCTSQTIRNIYYKMDDIYYNSGSTNLSIVTTLNELKNATEGTLLNGDMEMIVNTLNRATSIVKNRDIEDASKPEAPGALYFTKAGRYLDLKRSTSATAKILSTNSIKAFLDVASNLLKINNTGTWESIIYKEGRGAEMVIKSIDSYISAVVNDDQDSFTEPKAFVKDNLVLSVGAMTGCNKDVDFPNKSATSLPDWLINSDNKVHLQCSSAGQDKYFSSTFYKNVTNWIPFRTFEKALKNKTVNSAIASFSLFPEENTKLDPPIEVTFDVVNTSMKDPKCSYWKPDPNPYRGLGSWATDGCKLKSYKNGIVVCLCDHLTNFAILMSPVDPEEIPEAHTTALSIISLVGCIISMICLLITVVAYIVYWKKIRSERSIILLNLCVTLFIAYLVFLVGVNETDNKAGCTAVAVILHFVYLVVFLLMLVQGINLAITVIKPLRKQRFGWQMIIAAYGTSLLIVAISMGATQLDGYGSERFCWLSVDSGLLWAFLAPVLVVIVANSIIIVIVMRGMFGTAAVKKKTEKEKLRTGVRSICILMPVMGITWIFGVFSVNRETVVFQYLFAIFNSIQGILIFIFHCVLNQKIQEAFKKSKAGQLFTSETVTSDTERAPMKSAETADTTVKSYVV